MAENVIFSRFAAHDKPKVTKVYNLSWPELVDYFSRRAVRLDKNGPAWAPAIFDPCYRLKENAKFVYALVLDFDNNTEPGEMTPDWEHLTYFIHSSHSHTDQWWKWRVIFPLAKPVPAEDWERNWNKGFEHIANCQADHSCVDASRLFYLPSCTKETQGFAFTEHHEAGYLDLDTYPESTIKVQDPQSREVAERTGSTPLDFFHMNADWFRDVLQPAGWTFAHTDSNGTNHYWRPGKNKGSASACDGNGFAGQNNLWVYSSNAGALQARKSYTKHGAFAALYLDGDLQSAKSLRVFQNWKEQRAPKATQPAPIAHPVGNTVALELVKNEPHFDPATISDPDIDIETAALLSVIWLGDNERLGAVIKANQAAHFQEIPYRVIWSAISEVHQAGFGVDLLSIRKRLIDRGWMDRVGENHRLLSHALDSRVLTCHTESYFEQVNATWNKQALVTKLGDAAARIANGELSGSDVVATLQSLIDDSAERDKVGPTFEPFDYAALKTMPRKKWIVEDLLGDEDLGMFYGTYSTGKTFVILDLVAGLLKGDCKFAGRFYIPDAMSVIYATSEKKSGIPARIEAMRRCHDMTEQEMAGLTVFFDVPQLYDLKTPKCYLKFIEEMRRLKPHGVGLLIIDTKSGATLGSTENSIDCAQLEIEACHKIMQALGCSIIVVHHSGINKDDKGIRKTSGNHARGSSGWPGASDFLVEVMLGKGERSEPTRSIRCEKLGDGEQWKELPFKLEEVEGTESVGPVWGGDAKPVQLLQEASARSDTLDVLRASPMTWFDHAGILESAKGDHDKNAIQQALKRLFEEGKNTFGIERKAAKEGESKTRYNPYHYRFNPDAVGGQANSWSGLND